MPNITPISGKVRVSFTDKEMKIFENALQLIEHTLDYAIPDGTYVSEHSFAQAVDVLTRLTTSNEDFYVDWEQSF